MGFSKGLVRLGCMSMSRCKCRGLVRLGCRSMSMCKWWGLVRLRYKVYV